VVSAFGLPFMLMALAGAGAFHGRQDARTPLVVALAGNVANLVLEVVLIFGLGYGIGASALATVVAQVATALVFTRMVLRWAAEGGVGLRPVPAILSSLLWAGRPLVLRTVALRTAFTLATAAAARIGVAEVAAHQVAIQIWGTLGLALDAVAIAGQSLTGRWLGSGAGDRARDAARRMIELDVALGVVVGLVVLALRHRLAEVFSDDPELVAVIAYLLVWVAAAQPLNGYVFALDGVLIGAGDLAYLGRSMMAVSLAFVAMGAAVMATGAGLGWLWTALTAFMFLRATAVGWRWRSNRWIVTGAKVQHRSPP
jgi:putative MATE family efflux protein